MSDPSRHSCRPRCDAAAGTWQQAWLDAQAGLGTWTVRVGWGRRDDGRVWAAGHLDGHRHVRYAVHLHPGTPPELAMIAAARRLVPRGMPAVTLVVAPDVAGALLADVTTRARLRRWRGTVEVASEISTPPVDPTPATRGATADVEGLTGCSARTVAARLGRAVVYCDASSVPAAAGVPRPGAWAWVADDGTSHAVSVPGGDTTAMEVAAVSSAASSARPGRDLLVVTDSVAAAVRTPQGHGGHGGRRVTVVRVRAHRDPAGHDRADQLARRVARASGRGQPSADATRNSAGQPHS